MQVEGGVPDPLEAGQRLGEVGAVGLGDGGQHGGRHDRADHDRPALRCRAQDVVAEQHADLVPGQRSPRPVRSRDAHGEPVRVRIVGDDEVGLFPGCLGQRQVQCSRFLGVGEGDGGKVPVRGELLGDRAHVGVAEVLQRGDDVPTADAVHRRVDDLEVLGGGLERPDRGQVGEIAAEDPVGDGSGQRVRHRILGAGHLGGGTDPIDGSGDVPVRRRHDLGAVGVVHLVPVVLRRVVAGGHHHRRTRAEGQRRVGHHRGGGLPFPVAHVDAGRRQHRHGVFHELGAGEPGIASDHHRAVRDPSVDPEKMIGQAPCGADHDRPVHPVGARLHGAPQAGRPEFEDAVHALGELGEVSGIDQRLQLGCGHRVRIAGDPIGGTLQQIVHARTVPSARPGPAACGTRVLRCSPANGSRRPPWSCCQRPWP